MAANVLAHNDNQPSLLSKIEMHKANMTLKKLNKILNAPKVSVQSLYL